MTRLGCCFTLLVTIGCGATGQDRVELELRVAGSAGTELQTRDGTVLTLTRADLAFGPLYVCPGNQAGELCDTARLEWLDSTVIDLLDERSKRAGALLGVTGPVRSWMYDLGLPSTLTRDEPLVSSAAKKLGGVSLRVEGNAAVDAVQVPFTLAVAVRQGTDTERGVPVIRKSNSERFAHEVSTTDRNLLVRFDAHPWFANVDFAELVESECEDGLPEGCPEVLVVPEDSRAERAVQNAVTSGARPEFKWNSRN